MTRPQADLSTKGNLAITCYKGQPYQVQIRVLAGALSTGLGGRSRRLALGNAAEMFEAMEKYNEELVEAGIMLSGDGLKPSKLGKRIHFNNAKRSVTDGPFAETKELVAGYWVWQVRSMEEAVEWAKRCPEPDAGAERPRDPSLLGAGGLRP